MKKLKDGTTKPFERDDKVIYIPKFLLMAASDIGKRSMIKTENVGVVTSTNDSYVFVRYLNNEGSQATSPDDLYFIDHRPDLQQLLND